MAQGILSLIYLMTRGILSLIYLMTRGILSLINLINCNSMGRLSLGDRALANQPGSTQL